MPCYIWSRNFKFLEIYIHTYIPTYTRKFYVNVKLIHLLHVFICFRSVFSRLRTFCQNLYTHKDQLFIVFMFFYLSVILLQNGTCLVIVVVIFWWNESFYIFMSFIGWGKGCYSSFFWYCWLAFLLTPQYFDLRIYWK